MAEQLLKLFDRRFFIGCLLPVVLFSGTSYGLIAGLGGKLANKLRSSTLPFDHAKEPLSILLNTSAIVLLLWLFAILLLVMNRTLYMLLEGYGKYHPAHWVPIKKGSEKRRYRKLKTDLQEIPAKQRTKEEELQEERQKLQEKEEELQRKQELQRRDKDDLMFFRRFFRSLGVRKDIRSLKKASLR